MKNGKRLISLLLLIAIIFTGIPIYALAQEAEASDLVTQIPSETKIETPFTDVNEGDWFYDAVNYAYGNGIFDGTAADLFSPVDGMTRAMFVTTLGRFAGIDQAVYSGTDTGFKDVAADAYYAPYVAWAVEKGITNGVGDQFFDISSFVTREQLAVFVERFFKAYDVPYLSDANSGKTPLDLASVSSWARESVLNLYQAGVLLGDENGNFNPKTTATRAQAATVFMNTDARLDCRGVANLNEDSDTGSGENNGDSGSGGNNNDPGSGEDPIASKYTVRFVTNGGTDIEQMTVARGQTLGSLPIPIKAGYVFVGWYTDASLAAQFDENTVVTGNLTLYAKYISAETSYINNILEIASNYQIAEENPVDTDFEISLNASDTALTSDKVQEMLQFVCTAGVDDRGISVTGGSGSFTVFMDGGFKPGADYTLTLADGLTFADKDSTAKEYSFRIKKDESDNLAFNSGIIYIPASEVSEIYCNDVPVDTLSAAVYSVSEEGGTLVDISGYFTYSGSENLSAGDVLCVYSGLNPADADADSAIYDDIAYVKVTYISGSTISYESAEAQDVLFIAKTVAIPKNSLANFTENEQGFSFEVSGLTAANTWSIGDANPVSGEIAIGDTIALYDAPSLMQATPEDITLGTVTSISGSNPYTITCDITSLEELQQSLNYYQKISINMDDLIDSGTLDTGTLQREMRQQTLESGIIDELAAQYALLALEGDILEDGVESTDNLTVLMSDGTQASAGQLQTFMAAQSSEKKVKVSDVKVEPSFKSGGGELGDGALVATVKVSFDVTIKTTAGDSIKLSFSVTFTQELFLFVEADAGIDWGWCFFVPYPEECWINASLSVKTYSGVQLKATLTTVSADSSKTVDISEKIKEVIGGKEESNAVENVSGIYKHYQDFMENDLDYIEIVKKSLFKVNISLACGLVQITVEPHFVVSAAANAAVTCSLSYQEGTKYSFTARLSSASLNFDKSNILDKKFDFSLYLVGRLGLRVGIELELKAGLVSTKLNSMGIAAQAGLYIEWCGFFSYEYSRNFSQGTSTSVAQGAMYAELGVYLEIGVNFQAGDGKWQKNFGLVSEKFPLLSTNSKDYVYDFSYTLDKDEKFIINDENNSLPDYALKMIQLDLSSGKSTLQSYDASQFSIVFTNSAFSFSNGIIAVNTTEDYLKTDMTIVWKSSPLAFTSVPIKRTFHVIYTNSEQLVEKGQLTVNVGGSPVWSGRVDFGTPLKEALPDQDEILRLIGYSDYDRTIGTDTVNLRYDGKGAYKETLDGTVNGSQEFNYELPLRVYTVKVEDVQNKDGTSATQDFTAIYGGSFNLSGLNATGTEKSGETYTKFINVETRKDDEAAGEPLSGVVRETLAIQILSRGHTYHAAYMDNSSTVTYRFMTLVGYGIESKTEILKRNTRPVFNYEEHVKGKDYLVYSVSGDVTTPVNGDRTIYITCVPADGYELTLYRNGGTYVAGYMPPQTYNPTDGTDLPTGAQLRRAGYAFAGWYENSDFSGDPVKTVKGNQGPKTYYALWVAPEYTIRFDGAGGDGEMQEVSATFGVTVELPKCGYELKTAKPLPLDAGPPFLGWNTKADGTGIFYEDEAAIVIPEGVNAEGVLTLYAQWNDYKVTYYPNDPEAPVLSGGLALGAALKYCEQYPGTIAMQENIADLNVVLPDGTIFLGNGYQLTEPWYNKDIIFRIEEGSTVKLEKMYFYTNSDNDFNLMIENGGTLTIEDSIIYGMPAKGLICNLETGNIVIKNTEFQNNRSTLLSNAGTMILDSCLIKGNASADKEIVNQGLLVLNNTNYYSNGENSEEPQSKIYNDKGELYILNTTLIDNFVGENAGIESNGGLLYIVNSLIGGNRNESDTYNYNNIKFTSEDQKAYLYNSICGSNDDGLGWDEKKHTEFYEYEEDFSDFDDPDLKDLAAMVHLDYSNLGNIKIGFSFEGEFVSILNKATASTPEVTTYFGGEERQLDDNRVGAEYRYAP